LIVTFKSKSDREEFLRRLEREAPDLSASVRALATRETDLTVRGQEQARRVRALLGSDIRVHEDVRFQTMAS
jgi:hypothetical protein